MIGFGVSGAARVVPYRLFAPATETPDVAVAGVASRTLQRAEESAARYGTPLGLASYAALPGSDNIDATYVALPPALHYAWVRRTIEAGKHLLCEKPSPRMRISRERSRFARAGGAVSWWRGCIFASFKSFADNACW